MNFSVPFTTSARGYRAQQVLVRCLLVSFGVGWQQRRSVAVCGSSNQQCFLFSRQFEVGCLQRGGWITSPYWSTQFAPRRGLVCNSGGVPVCTFGELPDCNFGETSSSYGVWVIMRLRWSVFELRRSGHLWLSKCLRWSEFYFGGQFSSLLWSVRWIAESPSLCRGGAVFPDGFCLSSRSVPSLICCFVDLPYLRLRWGPVCDFVAVTVCSFGDVLVCCYGEASRSAASVWRSQFVTSEVSMFVSTVGRYYLCLRRGVTVCHYVSGSSLRWSVRLVTVSSVSFSGEQYSRLVPPCGCSSVLHRSASV